MNEIYMKQHLHGMVVLIVVLQVAAVMGCCDCKGDGKPIVEVPARHKPIPTMGRECWRVLTKYYEYRWSGRELGTDNPEVQRHHAVDDVVPVYVAFADPPGDDTEYSTWPHLKDNFSKGSPALEIIESNPRPDRPFRINNWCERNGSMTWGSPVTLDMAEYARWRERHPNLLYDGHLGEWCNDLNNAYSTLNGEHDVYGCTKPTNSEKRKAAFSRLFLPRPKTRYEQYDLLKRFYDMRRERNYGGKMSVLDAHLNTLHIAADFGASLVKMETTCSGQYRYQVSAMFTRGASRQFGIPWEWYVAGYMNGFSEKGEFLGDAMCRYPRDPESKPPFKHYGKVVKAGAWCGGKMRIGNAGPDFGISRSLFRRTHYLAYLSGANFITLEEWRDVVKQWDFKRRKTVFSPRGEIYCAFADFVRDHPARGAHYSPVAICVPIAQGYPVWGGAPFANDKFGYTEGDRAVDAVFHTLVPDCNYVEGLKRGEEMCIRNTQHANMYDVISPDAKSQTLEQVFDVMCSYRALVIVGDYKDRKWMTALAKYEAQGGKVYRVGAAELAEKSPGRSKGEAARYPMVESLLMNLQRAYFPFVVEGECLYGLTATDDHVWLYVLNNAGVTKFADVPERLDASKASRISVVIRDSALLPCRVTELVSGRPVALNGNSLDWMLPAGDLAIFEIGR